jgi:hypothetical protein
MSDEPKKKRGRPRKQVTNGTPITEFVKDAETATNYSIEHSDEIVLADRLTGEVTHTFELKNTNVSNTTEYKILGKPKVISAKQRQSISYRGNYYTFEYYEERELPISDDVNLAKEKESLWYSVNSEVDNQICDMLEFLQNKENN